MDFIVKNSDIIIERKDFTLDETLDCGQAFRWVKTDENTYQGARLNRKLAISQQPDTITFLDTSKEEFESVWKDYFDLETDYSELKKRFSADPALEKACSFAGGIRILKQDSWEALCSFIISQNNNIPRIKGIINRLCERFGGFPSPKDLSGFVPGDLEFLRSGFRAKYICDAVEKINSGEISLEKIAALDLESARKELMKIKGVGPKVAECTLLFGMYKTNAFPIDVWVKRVMAKWYPDGLPECVKGNEGIAQQYLFHYIRTCEEV